MLTRYLTFFLFQFSQYLLDTAHCFADIVVACSVTHTETFGVAKCIATYSSNMSFLKKIHGKVGGIANGMLAVGLSKEAAAFGEQIERAFRYIHLKSRYILSKFHNKVSSTLERLSHGLHALLVESVCSLSCFLAYRAWTACVLPLKFIASLTIHSGAAIYPILHPVMAYAFDTPLTIMALSLMPSTLAILACSPT